MKKLTATFMLALFVLAISSVSFANGRGNGYGSGYGGCGGSNYCYNR